MNEKIKLADVAARTGEVGLFITTVSFESRCKSLFFALNKNIRKRLFFINKDASSASNRNLEEMISVDVENSQTISLDLDHPTSNADTFQSVQSLIEEAPSGKIFIDITTFTHEQLLILMHVLSKTKITREIIFGYTGAERYSTNTTPENVWLTKGVAQVRTVLGYPGKFLPSRRLHLVVLVGFEVERARILIEQFEPTILSLGIGGRAHSVSSEHHKTNQRFFDELISFVELRKSVFSQVHTFEFSPVDATATKQSILQHCQQFEANNTVICPMNTKISTLGAGLAAMENQNLQISYSRAITYNELGYSEPADSATIFNAEF
ncbi:hypothetical protein ABIB42_001388 [Massilia sp. UYP32]|uniref:hypothetical protein n=1 Tax=Massilia sp. UYP32 TaxID=1756386 RepID=UPI003D22C6D2